MKKIVIMFLILVLSMLCFSINVAATDKTEYDISSGSLQIGSDDGDYLITGSTTENNIVIDGGTHTITLDNVTIDCSDAEKGALELKNGAILNLTLIGENVLISSCCTNDYKNNNSFAGIQVPEGCTLTIKGNGTLDVEGGRCAAAIGSCARQTAGIINIESGTITAKGKCNGAGIGGGNSGKGGTVNISGGFVTAEGSYAAGIGGGTYRSGGTVNISAGTVVAVGNGSSAGIGEAYGNTEDYAVTATISGGNVYARSTNIGCDDIGRCQSDNGHTVSLTDGQGNDLHVVNIVLDEYKEGDPINSIGFEGYSLKEAKVIKYGLVFVYLPEDITVTTITAGGVEYEKSHITVSVGNEYIHFKPISYTANFVLNGGSYVGKQSINKGEHFVKPVNPTKVGYTFGGWYADAEFNTPYDFNSEVTSDVTIYAKWTTTHTVTFKDYDETVLAMQEVNHGEDAIPPTVPEREGYTFEGWGIEPSYKNVTSDRTIIAQYTIKSYTLKYSAAANGSVTGEKEQTVNYGSDGTEVIAVADNGYNFIGWSDGEKNAVRTDQNVSSNIDVSANFGINSYLVNFDVDGGSKIDVQNIGHGQKALKPKVDPTKEGYTFGGWYADSEFKAVYDFETLITSNATIYAKWQVRSHHKKKTSSHSTPKDETKDTGVILNGKEVDKDKLQENLKEVIKNKETSDKKLVEISIVKEKSNDVEDAVTGEKTDTAKATLKGDIVKILEDKDFELSVKREDVQYNIPAKDLSIASVAETLGVSRDKLKDVEVEIQITKTSKDVTKKYEEYVKANKQELVAPPIEFNVVAKTTKTDGDVKKVNINKFKEYAERVMEIPEGVEPNKITTGIVFNKDGSYSHIPTIVFQKNNKWYAKLNSLTNSDYSVIWNPVTVSSVKNHWSQKSVNDMAARLVIEDVNGFNPNKSITRGEFATYLVKALGLYRNDYMAINAKQFMDVSKMNDAINIASEWGIVKGYTDNTFKPEAVITRTEAMIMVSRAMAIVDLAEKNSDKIENFKDKNQLKIWAYESAKKTVSAGLFNGNGNNKLNPRQCLTYAEAVTVIRNLLTTAQLINE